MNDQTRRAMMAAWCRGSHRRWVALTAYLRTQDITTAAQAAGMNPASVRRMINRLTADVRLAQRWAGTTP